MDSNRANWLLTWQIIIEPGDMVTLEFMNQGRECWELSGMESGSQTLRDKTGKTPWSEILKGIMFPEQFPESFKDNSNNVIPNNPSGDFSGAGTGNLWFA